MPIKAFVVLNPVAGQSDPDQVKDFLEKARMEDRWSFELYETTGDENLKEIVGAALEKDVDLVLACGGDGTVSGVADGLAGSDTPLGILPVGTANAFATELSIPDDPGAALDLVLGAHKVKAVDAIQCKERFFLLEASLGIIADSMKDVAREEKDRLGWLAYVGTMIRNWIGVDPLLVQLDVDGTKLSFRASEVALFNTSQVGIIEEDLDEEIRLDDGLLDLYVLRSKSALDMFRLLIYRLVGHPRKAPRTQYWRVEKAVRIDSKPRVSYQADGDIQGKTPATFGLARGVLKVIVPRSTANI